MENCVATLRAQQSGNKQQDKITDYRKPFVKDCLGVNQSSKILR